ncbi:MAG: PIN domain-containing protein [Firmicutes bacterium]|nr:PIN domain-containing protein [Bacillota bacterium]
MLMRITRLLIAVLGGLIGLEVGGKALYPVATNYLNFGWAQDVQLLLFRILGATVFGLIFYIFSPGLIKKLGKFSALVEGQMQRIPTQDIIISTVGLMVGLIIANLLGFALVGIPFVGPYLPIISNIALGYLGLMLAHKKREELGSLLSFPGRSSKAAKKEQYKVLDTSVIIDGRIADVVRAGFLEGVLVVPTFVLEELRHIADSSDSLRRNRGRRGLDILQDLQKQLGAGVLILEKDYDDLEVDSKLIKLAQEINGKLLTTDYNLNKICELQGVPVLNINELANSLKPVVLPGEEMVVHVLKEGKENNQGVAYLDDGTMIVVDNGRKHIGEDLPVVVTSVLQTAAGRMIFARVR